MHAKPVISIFRIFKWQEKAHFLGWNFNQNFMYCLYYLTVPFFIHYLFYLPNHQLNKYINIQLRIFSLINPIFESFIIDFLKSNLTIN